MEFPIAFAERMKRLLGTEYDRFYEAFAKEDAVKGLRVNAAKLPFDAFATASPFPLREIPYVRGGFIVDGECGAGKHPYHHAGAYYMQDPGAMATVAALPADVLSQSGLRVLDLCAAPGGKTTQLASEILPRGGILLANEYNASRARILAGNVERMGLPNVCVTNLDTAVLKETYPDTFDLVVCDAPCSGEGMFRKNDRAIEEWNEGNVRASAERQRTILENGAACVTPGGYLLYSTCTYATEENEENVVHFLSSHPDFSLVPCADAVVSVTASGVSAVSDAFDLSLCRRFYPHLSLGEGQFIALMRRDADAPVKKREKRKNAPKETDLAAPQKQELDAANAFLRETLGRPLCGIGIRGGTLVAIPVWETNPLPSVPVGTVALGAAIGEARKGRVVPHHHFFTAFGAEMQNRVVLDPSDERVAAYLGGEEIAVDAAQSGYCAVMLSVGAEAITLGGGKASGGRLKNYYPKGLRVR